MYTTLLTIHSYLRWALLILMVYSIFRALKGYIKNTSFTKTDNGLRHWTATTAHIQLIIGILLYTKSPIVKSFWYTNTVLNNTDLTFYGLIHIILMFISITLLTIGSALAKRKLADRDKFKTVLIWFSIALIIILIAIPWPFSPLATRPLLRSF